MKYRVPELDELDEIGRSIHRVVHERRPDIRIVQMPLEGMVGEPTAEYRPEEWNPLYRNLGGSKYSVFVARVPEDPGLGIVDIEKRTVQRKLS